MEKTKNPLIRLAPLLLVAMLVVPLLSGCIGGGGSSNTGPEGSVDEKDDEDNLTNNTSRKNKSRIELPSGQEVRPDSSVHVHDNWGERQHVLVMDKNVSVDWGQTVDRPSLAFQPAFEVDISQGEDRGADLIWPGTGKVKITLEWEGSAGASPQLCVTNQGRSNPCNGQVQNWGSSGDSWEIERSEDGFFTRNETDPPHAPKSFWRFKVWFCESGGRPQCPQARGINGFRLRVETFRANETLPVDPPHFAFYGDNDSIPVMPETVVTSGDTVDPQVAGTMFAATTTGESPPVKIIDGVYLKSPQVQSENPIVPPQTQKVQMTLEWSSATPASFELRYKHASMMWSAEWQDPPSSSSCGDGCIEYTIPTSGDMLDSPYALRTQWVWGVFPQGDPPTPRASWSISVGITAVKSG